jgi:hypothetical protein
MLQSEFIDHLARKGALRDPQSPDGSAVSTLRQWKFRPYAEGGRSAEIETGLIFRSKQTGM